MRRLRENIEAIVIPAGLGAGATVLAFMHIVNPSSSAGSIAVKPTTPTEIVVDESDTSGLVACHDLSPDYRGDLVLIDPYASGLPVQSEASEGEDFASSLPLTGPIAQVGNTACVLVARPQNPPLYMPEAQKA